MAEPREDPKIPSSSSDLPRAPVVSIISPGSDAEEVDGEFVQPKPAHSGRSTSPRPRTRSAARAMASSDPAAEPEEPAPMDLSKRPPNTDDEEPSDAPTPDPASSVASASPLSQAKISKKRMKRRSKGCYEPKKSSKKKRASEDPDWDAVEAFSGRMTEYDTFNDATKTAVVKTYCCASRSTDGKICVRKKECSQHSQEQRAEARVTLLEGVVSRAKATPKPRPSG